MEHDELRGKVLPHECCGMEVLASGVPTFDNRQKVPLHAFGGGVRAMAARLVNNPQEDVVELGRCSCAAGLNLTSLYEITQRLCAKKTV